MVASRFPTVILLKIDATPGAINIIRAYAPTTGSDDDEIERFYEQMVKARRH